MPHHAPFYRILKDGVVLGNEQFVVFKERICLIQEETSPRAKRGERCALFIVRIGKSANFDSHHLKLDAERYAGDT